VTSWQLGGRLLKLLDFAGQQHFFSAHGLQTWALTTTFLAVFDRRKTTKENTVHLSAWLSLLCDSVPSQSTYHLRVAFVGTHSDCVLKTDFDELFKNLRSEFEGADQCHLHPDCFEINYLSTPSAVDELREWIHEQCQRDTELPVPSDYIETGKELVGLTADPKFAAWPVLNTEDPILDCKGHDPSVVLPFLEELGFIKRVEINSIVKIVVDPLVWVNRITLTLLRKEPSARLSGDQPDVPDVPYISADELVRLMQLNKKERVLDQQTAGEEVLVGLGLAFKRTESYVLPGLLPEVTPSELSHWSHLCKGLFVGRRYSLKSELRRFSPRFILELFSRCQAFAQALQGDVMFLRQRVMILDCLQDQQVRISLLNLNYLDLIVSGGKDTARLQLLLPSLSLIVATATRFTSCRLQKKYLVRCK